MTAARGAKQPRRRRGDEPARRALVDRIISGGQTGADRGALDAALALGARHGGWCPKGRRAEDGPIPSRYRLRETASADYRVRTRKNVEGADATAIFSGGALWGGTLLTARLAKRMNRPLIILDARTRSRQAIRDFQSWLAENRVRTLNVAGPRESQSPGIGAAVRAFLERSFGGCSRRAAARSRR